jgi:hypothetical protein
MLATLVTFSFPLPWGIAPVVFSAAAVVAGLAAARGLWRAGVRGAQLTMSVLFAVFAGLVSLTLLASLALYPLRVEFEACMRDAVTLSATERCQTEYNDAIVERFSPATDAPTD